MYININDIYMYFEYRLAPDNHYLCKYDYRIYSEDQKKELLILDNYDIFDFVFIRQIDFNLLAVEYLLAIYEKRLAMEKNHKNFISVFFSFIDGNGLSDDWYNFEKEKLIDFGRSWCEENGINYTLK